jgi:uroporphyrinogen III methyltransferase/synthase
MPGLVTLVGAGPGDPRLITLRGKQALEQAEVVVFDAACDPALLALAPSAAERIALGGSPGERALSEGDLHALLIERARAGARVVRLKNGDPFVFGRGGEEAQALAAAGIPFAIVPGVPAFVAAAAYAGIPATLRAVSSQMTVAFAQPSPGPDGFELDFDALARVRGTAVVYLDPHQIPPVVKELVRRGRSPLTPAAVVSSASLSSQRVAEGTLGAVARMPVEAPCILFVGEAARERAPLAWAERRPLFGRSIVLTRAAGQNGPMAARLEELGAEVLELPCIAIAPPASFGELDLAIRSLARFDWVAFTSPNGVAHFLARLTALGKDARALSGVKLAAVGASTAEALAAAHLKADLVPREFHAEALARALDAEAAARKRFLIVRALEGREVLFEALRARGAEVELAVAYQTVRPDADPGPVRARAAQGRLSAVAFASPSAVRNFVSFFEEGEGVRLLKCCCIAAIGPVTAKALEELGIQAQARPNDSTAEDLVQALAAELGKSRPG